LQAVAEGANARRPEGEQFRPRVRVATLPSEGGVLLEICDNGVGMDQETVKRASEPLFTTRARGTGLGLAVVQKIVQEHGGVVAIKSTPYTGTAVSVLMPRAKGAQRGAGTA
jgi:nitrogen fixation/metabolism regulation signal transduction histidine kinase